MTLINRKLFVVAALAIQLLSAETSFGQAAFRELPLEKGDTSKAIGMLRNKEGLDVAVVTRYAKNEMARLTGKDLANYANIRNAMLLTIRTGESDAGKKAAADAIVTYARGIAGSNAFHPASRINAMLTLAELDAGSNLPYPGCFEILLASAKDANLPMHLRAIALMGLNRQVKAYNANISPAKKQEVSRELVAIAASQPKTALDIKMHAWLVRRAYDVLSSMGAPGAVNPALARVVNDKELPSLRLASLEYLSKIDLTPLPEDKKIQYFLGVAQLLEYQLVRWYTNEDDRIKAKSGAAAGGMMGGYGSDMMGGYGSDTMGSDMAGMGSDMMGSSGMDGYGSGSDAYGGYGGTAPVKKKAIDTQTWDVRIARRSVNHVAQLSHVALDGKPLKDARAMSASAKALLDIKLPDELAAQATKLVEAVENFQTMVNDPAKITNMSSLLQEVEAPIEAVMDLVREIPEFKVQYPDYKDGDELATVEEEKPAAAPAPTPDGEADAGAAKPNAGAIPPVAPKQPNGAAN